MFFTFFKLYKGNQIAQNITFYLDDVYETLHPQFWYIKKTFALEFILAITKS